MAQDWRDYIGVLGLAGSVLVLCEEQRNEAQRPPREPALFPAKRPNHLLKRSHDIIKGISDAGRISSIPAYQKRRYYEAPYDNNALRIGSFLVSPAGVHIDIRMPDLVAPNTQTTVRIGPRTNTTVRIGPHTNTTIEISPHTDKIVQIAWKPPPGVQRKRHLLVNGLLQHVALRLGPRREHSLILLVPGPPQTDVARAVQEVAFHSFWHGSSSSGSQEGFPRYKVN